MKVGISTASFYNTGALEDAPARIKALGASIAEVFLNTFSEYAFDFIQLLKSRLDIEDIEVYSVHPMGTQFEPQLFSPHPRQREDAWRIFEQVLAAGKHLGAKCYVMHGPAGQYGAVKNMEFSRIGPITRDLCALAKEYGLKIAWENVSWCLFSEPEFAPRILEATHEDTLRFTLDIKQAMRSGHTPEAYIRAIGTHFINLHICDYVHRANGMFSPALPGCGECNLSALKAALLQKGYEGPAFLEVYSDLYRDDAMLKDCFAYISGQLL